MVDILERNIKEIMNASNIKTFGFIVYNEENPTLIKLLRDDDNWNALDKISGEKFYIFAVKPKKGSKEFLKYPDGMLGFMVPVWQEPKDNNKLLEIFDITSTQKLPLFFVFTKVGPYLLKHSIKINENSVDDAFNQLKSIFYKIDDISKKIHNEYSEHPAQVHDKIAEILQKENFKKTAYDVVALFGVLSKIIKAL